MKDRELYITRFSAWAPGVENREEWDDWALGKQSISPGTRGPEISFTEPMFRRRLSQISKMTIQVIHDLLPIGADTKITFLSFRGEISRQFQINKMLIEEKALAPAAFSLSVFNAPVALASIALGLKGGYSALFPGGKNPFAAGLGAVKAALLSGKAAEAVFVYADEEAPREYKGLMGGCPTPAAFGLLLSGDPKPLSLPLSVIKPEEDNPLVFLKQVLLNGKIYAPS